MAQDDLADVLALVDVAVGVGALLERERWPRPPGGARRSSVHSLERRDVLLERCLASQSVSMLRPITALDSRISLSGLKRGICASTRSARARLRRSPAWISEAPKQTSRPPGRSSA